MCTPGGLRGDFVWYLGGDPDNLESAPGVGRHETHEVDGRAFTGGGLQAELSFGYELLRASTIRMFGSVDVTLPLYLSDEDFGGARKRYTPTVLFSVGGGIGKVRTVRVIND